MTERDPLYDAIKLRCKSKFDADRDKFMSQAIAQDDGGWIKHTHYHWSRNVDGKRLDYWPSRKKWQYNGKVQRGNVHKFLKQIRGAVND